MAYYSDTYGGYTAPFRLEQAHAKLEKRVTSLELVVEKLVEQAYPQKPVVGIGTGIVTVPAVNTQPWIDQTERIHELEEEVEALSNENQMLMEESLDNLTRAETAEARVEELECKIQYIKDELD